jgi:hypothetical protein
VYLIEIHCLQAFGDLTRAAVGNLAIIDFTDRRDFRRCAGKKRFIGDIHFIARDTAFLDRYADLGGQLLDRVARDAVQAGRQLGRIDDTAANDKNILAGAFSNIASS